MYISRDARPIMESVYKKFQATTEEQKQKIARAVAKVHGEEDVLTKDEATDVLNTDKYDLAIKNRLTIKSSVGSIMERIGESYDVELANEVQTKCSVLTYDKVKKFGIDLDKVFIGCGGKETFDPATNIRNGYIVNLDLYQQAALLRAIVKKCPEFKDKIGLYNLRPSRDVYEILNSRGLVDKGIYWFWTGEQYKPDQVESKYSAPGLVTADKLSKEAIKSARFCFRNVAYGHWDLNDPDRCGDDGAVVLGGIIE